MSDIADDELALEDDTPEVDAPADMPELELPDMFDAVVLEVLPSVVDGEDNAVVEPGVLG